MKQFIFVLTVIIISSNLFANSGRDTNEEELRKIIEPLNEVFVNAILDDDLETYLSLYTEDATILLPFLPPINGKHALTVHWHNNMATGDLTEYADVKIIDIWSSENTIYTRGSYQITFKKFENKPKAVYGSYFSVWKKQKDGTYKMRYDISNLDHGI